MARPVARPRNAERAAAISELLKPCDAQLMRCYPVSSRINQRERMTTENVLDLWNLCPTQNQLFS